MKILILDDHPAITLLLNGLLRETAEDSIIYEVHSIKEALIYLNEHRIDRVICDLQIVKGKNLEIPAFCKENGIPFLVFTSHLNTALIRELKMLNMLCFVSKASATEELMLGLKALLNNESYCCSLVEKNPGKSEVLDIPRLEISPAERKVLELLNRGTPLVELSKKLNLSVTTIQNHKARIADRNNCTINEAIYRFNFWEE